MTPHRVQLTRTVTTELAVVIYAVDAKEAERLALELVPEESRDWTPCGVDVVARAEGRT